MTNWYFLPDIGSGATEPQGVCPMPGVC